jgi:restriction endonuclease S subunit
LKRDESLKKRIRDIAEIRTGFQFRGKVEVADDANVALIQIKDIDDRLKVQLQDLLPVKLDNPEPYLVTQGDVLFLSRGHRQYAAPVSEPVRNTVATGYFFILHPNQDMIRSDFLAWSINQPEFQDALRPFTRGSHMPLVSKSDFQDLTIGLPTMAVQDRILALQQLIDRERELTTDLQLKRGKLVGAISRELLAGRLKIKD